MSGSSLHVLIVGGGLGGLCLAQGLRQSGVSVTVYERDVTPAIRRQGYRLHIDARGANALRSCLPSHLFELFLATASPPGHQITVMNHHLRKLKVIGSPTVDASNPTRFTAGVDRLTLREILLADLEEVISFGKAFQQYQFTDGKVQASFADGTVATGDVLVAADGVHSRIRQQLLPQATLVDTGTRCIYGKVELSEAIRPLIPDALHHGFTVAVSRKLSLALGLVEFRCPPAQAAAQLAPSVQFHSGGDYLMWSLNASRALFAASDDELFRLNGTGLHHLVLKQIHTWHPTLRALIAASDPAEIFPIAVRTSVPCDPWPSAPVTLLGDAIHAMSPAGGSGANMALRDAQLLCETLTAIAQGERPLLQAMHAYEAQMLKDGFEAVRFSTKGGVLAPSAPAKRSLLRPLLRGPRVSS
ncbi:MAG TPA: NAD(P)/FAD-dependent oxidoreductase [Ktedonobacteraceae bacterium]|nr:NAD(P)/FAD-dependent oxidoreductase [Ktedonobacteraceae bacterium]